MISRNCFQNTAAGSQARARPRVRSLGGEGHHGCRTGVIAAPTALAATRGATLVSLHLKNFAPYAGIGNKRRGGLGLWQNRKRFISAERTCGVLRC